MNNDSPIILPSRREFVKLSTATAIGSSLLGTLGIHRSAHAAGDETIKLGLVGCGGRGTGAAAQALQADSNTKLVAMGDVFEDRLTGSRRNLEKQADIGAQMAINDDKCFLGFDAYKKVIEAGVDMVILATPPGFRPMQFAAAVAAGKHVFMEKPVATDAPGVRTVLEATKEAKKKNLLVGVGLQRHHQPTYIETIKRLQDGEIGDIVCTRVYWNGTTPWVKERTKLEEQYGRALTDMEYQMRNWYYFTWLGGDHIVEQHIHNIDVGNWLMNGAPVKANGMGGCEVRKGPDYGETFDHHCVEFEYENGTKMFSQCRHIPGCWNQVAEFAHGTKGVADISNGKIGKDFNSLSEVGGENRARGARGRKGENGHALEHVDYFASLRSGNPINEGEWGAMSTMTAILGRMATYSGKEVMMKDALERGLQLVLKDLAMDATPPAPSRAVPGLTKVLS